MAGEEAIQGRAGCSGDVRRGSGRCCQWWAGGYGASWFISRIVLKAGS